MKVFLSSTAEDLDAYRKVAEDTILQLSQRIDSMKYWGALPGTPVEESERRARDSDVVVCIVAHRYGSGITRLEVEAAHKAGKDVLVWIVADDYPWTHKREETLLADPDVFGDPAKAEDVRQRVQALFDFKAWLQKTFTVDRFTTPDDLGRKIAVALTNYVKGHAAPAIPEEKISISRLPVTGAELFGREAELQLLDEAWESSNTNIVSFIAWGGVGKTALVNRWLKQHMARANYRGAERVYGWSFFSQGTTERAASADLFIDQTLRWFGDTDAAAGSPWDKGERLARYIRQSRTLLILDGLEPLQHPPGSQEGRLKDATLQALLVELAAHQSGLCVISTRERVGDLVEFENGTVIQHNLEQLSPRAGAQILRSLNVKGDDDELELASQELGGHAFSLTLLGSYLNEVLDGDIRQRDAIGNLFEDTRFGDDAERMIAAYEKWLGEGMELAILRLLGLFDRPADLESLSVLREPPPISGLTEPLQSFKGREWNQAVAKLRRIKLLGGASPTEPGALDAHPLIREYFKQQLKRGSSRAWQTGNDRLYTYLIGSAQFPDSVEKLTKLFLALAHGCEANKHEQAFEEIAVTRLLKDRRNVVKDLGAYSAALIAITGFFETPWHKPINGLSLRLQALLLNMASFCLRPLGRLREAIEATQLGLQLRIKDQFWGGAALDANHLSELHMMIGNLVRALEFAQQALEFADRHPDKRLQVDVRSTFATVLHQLGREAQAKTAFEEAEALQQEVESRRLVLYSVRGFEYCALLLDEGKVDEVKERANQMQPVAKVMNSPLELALVNLLLGKIALEEMRCDGGMQKASGFLECAVEGFRDAATTHYLPHVLLALAEFHRYSSDFVKAERYLTDASRIARRTGMGLHHADYHLESARLRIVQGDKHKAHEHLTSAKEEINRMGYHRRDKEVAELEAQLA